MRERNERGSRWPWIVGGTALTAAALMGATAWNRRQAARAERRSPAQGRFVDVDGIRLHYLEKGQGPVVLLIHGTGTQATDFVASGLFELLARQHRVIAIDRPGHGYSGWSPNIAATVGMSPGLRIIDDEFGDGGLIAEPGGKRNRFYAAIGEAMTGTAGTPQEGLPISPAAQATLLGHFLDYLDIDDAVVVGHSFGATVAAAMAVLAPERVRGLVLVGGYFYPSMRVDALAGLQQVPVLGHVVGQAITPLVVRGLARHAARRMFAPQPVASRFEALVPRGLRARPSQVDAAAREKALMVPGVFKMRKRYWEILQPTAIFVGDADDIVEPGSQSLRLHRDIPHSDLRVLPRVGHMAHYAAARKIAQVVGHYAAFGGTEALTDLDDELPLDDASLDVDNDAGRAAAEAAAGAMKRARDASRGQ